MECCKIPPQKVKGWIGTTAKRSCKNSKAKSDAKNAEGKRGGERKSHHTDAEAAKGGITSKSKKPKKKKRMKSKGQVGQEKEETFFCRAQEESSKEEDTEEPDEYLTIANNQVTSMEQNGNFIIEKKRTSHVSRNIR